MRQFLRAKIHRATVTEANTEYIGSVTIDASLMERVNLAEYEKVLVADLTNGARLETYALKGEPDSGTICINGAAAHLVEVGHQVIIMAFGYGEPPVEPKQILVDASNQYQQDLEPGH